MKQLLLAAALAVTNLPALASGQAPSAGPTSAPAAAPVPQSPDEWRQAARNDIRAAYDIFVENHPGMHDPSNRGFPAQLMQARDRGLAEAERATDRGGYSRALGMFTGELSDGHAAVYATAPAGAAQTPPQWPGFIAGWRHDRLVVQQATAASPAPVGATIVSCDGKPAADFLRERLLTRGFRPREAGQWWARAPQAFVATPVLPGGPTHCVFLTAAGERDLPLTWTPAPADIDALRRRASDGERTDIGLTEPHPGLFLIGLPDFQPNEAAVAAYQRLFEQLRSRRPELMRSRGVVLDLRYNNGGSSAWSQDVASILWGGPQVARAMQDYFRGVEIWWRASPGTVAYMTEMEQNIRRSGHDEIANEIRTTGAGMQAALQRGEPFHRVPEESGATGSRVGRSDFTVPVYVITPGGCASACLDAVDVFTRFPNTKLIGAPTSADSTYMEVRQQDLPSGLGRIVLPTKIWMGRPRRSGQIYEPLIVVDDLGWSTAAFLDRIERDLSRR
jgi:hypothetical protein